VGTTTLVESMGGKASAGAADAGAAKSAAARTEFKKIIIF
jgi:hypothetical protein